MKTATLIDKKITALRPGQVVGYDDLGIQKTEYLAAAKAMSRMVKAGVLKRATTGLFYKPKKSAFGELKPQEEELLRPYLFDNKKRIAYITGTALYNQMGLTTQIPSAIQVASREKRIVPKIGSLRIKSVKSYVDVTDNNYKLLEWLDATKDFKMIPDFNKQNGLQLLKSRLKKLSQPERKTLAKIALAYPPRTRALTGAILEYMNEQEVRLDPLKESLNTFTTFDLGIAPRILPTAENWKITVNLY